MQFVKKLSLPLFLVVALASSSVFTGCSDDDPDTTGNNDTEITSPRTGSTYNYTEYGVDASGQKDPATELAVTATVSASGLSIAGKTDVLKFKEVSTEGEDSTYIKYESNNDMSILLGVPEYEEIDPIWVKIPFGSKTKQNYTLTDSIDDGSGNMMEISLAIETSYLREETVTVQSESLKVWVGQVKLTGSFPGPFGGMISFNSTGEISFAPKIGYIYKTDDKTAFGTLSTDHSVRLLLSYSLVN